MLIDSHCHLDDDSYKNSIDAVINRALLNGVGGILIPGANPDDLPVAKEISDKYKNIFFCVGAHPHHIDKYDERLFLDYAKNKKCIAIGESGLDYFKLKCDSMKQKQVDVFKSHIELSIRLKKPLIIHTRDANLELATILKQYDLSKIKAVFHCYVGYENLLEFCKYDFYYSISGIVTFKNAKEILSILSKIPKDKIIVETDSPYLTPHPYRSRLNEPSFVTLVAKKVAETLGMSYDSFETLSLKNTKALFKEFNVEL